MSKAYIVVSQDGMNDAVNRTMETGDWFALSRCYVFQTEDQAMDWADSQTNFGEVSYVFVAIKKVTQPMRKAGIVENL